MEHFNLKICISIIILICLLASFFTTISMCYIYELDFKKELRQNLKKGLYAFIILSTFFIIIYKFIL